MKFLSPINLSKNELQNAVIQNLATAPTSPATGQIYFDTGDSEFYIYDGATWVSLGGATIIGGTGVSVSVSGQEYTVNHTNSIVPAGVQALRPIAIDDEGHIESYGTEIVSLKNPNTITMRFDGGTTEGTDQYTYDGSAAKLFNITAGANVTIDKAAGAITINSSYVDTIDYINAASFAAGSGILTLSGVGNAGATVNLDGRYLQVESDTLDSVTGRGATTANSIEVGGMIVNGDLVVTGTMTTKNAQQVDIGDNIIVLNHEEVLAPTENAGIEIERGTSTNVSILWNETLDFWTLTNDGSNYHPISRKHSEDITGTAAASQFTVTHNLGSTDVTVSVKEATTNELVMTDVTITNVNSITVTLNPIIANGKVYRVTVIG